MHLLKIYFHYNNKADGYFNLTTLSGTSIQLYNTTAGNLQYTATNSINTALGCVAPAAIGDNTSVYYVFDSVRWFKFVYAIGTVPLQ